MKRQWHRSQVPSPRSQGSKNEVDRRDSVRTRQVAQACASADVDVVAFGPSGVVVLRNRYSSETKQRTLERVEQSFGDLSGTTAATAADVDGDGDLDLVIAASSGVTRMVQSW